jgi:hypothetical protein
MTDKGVDKKFDKFVERGGQKKTTTGKKEKGKSKDDSIFTSFIETEKFLVEQIATLATGATRPAGEEQRCLFAIYNKGTGSIEEKKQFIHEGSIYKPINDEISKNNIIALPTEALEYGTTRKLTVEIKSFLEKYFEVPKFYESLLPYLILFYWVYDKFPFIPYVHFLGRTGTGKTTAAEALSAISYKPVDASGAITISSIFRIASRWRGTLFLDEFNPGGDGYREMITLLKSGVSDKAVFRVEGEGNYAVRAFLIKCPKIFTSEKPIYDSGLRSRVIEIRMEKNKRKIPLYRPKSYFDEAQELRNKLLLWRFKNYPKIDLKKIEYGFEELNPFDGRVQQVVTPIYYMADKASRKEIIKFAQEQEEETLRERREELHGKIFEYLVSNYKPDAGVTLPEIFEHLTSGGEYPKLTSKRVGNDIRKLLRIDIKREGHDNVSTLQLRKKAEKLKELSIYYGIFFPEGHVAHVAHVAPGTKVKKVSHQYGLRGISKLPSLPSLPTENKAKGKKAPQKTSQKKLPPIPDEF